MLAYKHPGVYIEEIQSGARPIETVETSTTAFLGYGLKGPINEPFAINKWDDYEKEFGGIANKEDSLGMAVWAYFLNGGRKAIIVRLAGDNAKAAHLPTPNPIKKRGDPKVPALVIEAKYPGEQGNEYAVQITEDQDDNLCFTIKVAKAVQEEDGKIRFDFLKEFSKLEINEKSPKYFKNYLENDPGNIYIKANLPDEAKNQGYFNEGTFKIDLSNVDPINFTDITPESNIFLKIDGNGEIGIKLKKSEDEEGDELEFNNLTEVIGRIQEKVSSISDKEKCYLEFKAEISDDEKTITFTSGSGHASFASVDVTGGTLKEQLIKKDEEGKENVKKVHGSENAVPKSTVDEDGNFSYIKLEGGVDDNQCNPSEHKTQSVYKTQLSKLRKYPEVNIIVLPGRHLGEGRDVADIAISHCEEETLQNRMVIIDPPPQKELTTTKEINLFSRPESDYSVLYYPWIEVSNPFYDPEHPGKDKENRTISIAPSAFAAAIWAKTDGKRGVWKAPAGVETSLLGVAKLQYYVEDSHQDILNELGVNCIRTLPGYGSVIWGARTLASKTKPEWRYISVRRTTIMIKESIKNAIQWAVFEPNNESLWSALRTNIGAFMNGLFRAGAFQGKKVSDAYFVRCGLDDTMTQNDINLGQVIVIVGFAPLRPAEFVIVRIQQKVGVA